MLNKNIKNIIGLYLLPEKYIIKCRKEQCLNQIIICCFIKDNIINDPLGRISLLLLYQLFKVWFKYNNYGNKMPTKNELLKYLIDKWGITGSIINPTCIGYKFKYKIKI